MKQFACRTDISQPVATMLASAVAVPGPMICYVPFLSKSSPLRIIEGKDDTTKFYTGLASFKLFQHILSVMYDCTIHTFQLNVSFQVHWSAVDEV